MEPPKKKRKTEKAKRLTDSERLKIISLSEEKKFGSSYLARQFGVTESAIRAIVKKSEDYKARAEGKSESQRQQMRPRVGMYQIQVDLPLVAWITAKRMAKCVLPPQLVRAKAEEIAKAKGLSDFKASKGWFRRFRRRHGLNATALWGEGGKVDKADPDLLRELDQFCREIECYAPERVYNMDETGLFFRLVPNYSVVLEDEPKDDLRGTEN